MFTAADLTQLAKACDPKATKPANHEADRIKIANLTRGIIKVEPSVWRGPYTGPPVTAGPIGAAICEVEIVPLGAAPKPAPPLTEELPTAEPGD